MKEENFKNIDLSGYSVPVTKSKAEAWEMLHAKIKEDEGSQTKVKKLNWFLGSGAAAAIFIGVLYLGMFNTGKYSSDIFTKTEEVDSIYLPDNSLVALNYNSTFKYHYNKISGNRSVILSGEAYFDVEKGKSFEVDFDGGKVSVKGTSFDILAYSNELIEVNCTEGVVVFSYNQNNIELRKGQAVKVFKGSLGDIYPITPKTIEARITGVYNWDRVTVDELMMVIGARFGYQVDVNDDIQNRNFSGRIDLTNLHECLTVISYAMDMRYSIDDTSKKITINAK